MTRHSWEVWGRELVADFGTVPLTSMTAIIFGRSLSRSEYNALTRAARRMAARGEIGLVRVLDPDLTGRPNRCLVAVRADLIGKLQDQGIPVGASVPRGTDAPSSASRQVPGSVRWIAKLTGVSKTTVWRWTRDHAETGNDGRGQP
jgi:DNA invertase Pin-like site-specific DNA recombinase